VGWYTVRKRINGRYYLYLQMTYRSGGKVKTKNKYIGPVDGTPFSVEPRAQAAIASDIDAVRIEAGILKDHLGAHPARRFLKYRGRTDRQSVGGTSFAELNAQALLTGTKGKHLDTMLSESGFSSFEDLDESVEEYFSTKQQLLDLRAKLNTLRTETRYAAHYHRALGTRPTPESVIREIKERSPPAPRPKPIRKPRAPPPPKIKKLSEKTPKLTKPAGGLKIDRIRRLKPRARAFLNRQTAKHRLKKEAEANLDLMLAIRREGREIPDELREKDRLYRFTQRRAFGTILAVRKKGGRR
jgi:hypothetical protein